MKIKDLSVIAVFFLFPILFFTNKAVNIDDVPFLAISRQIINDPLRPYSFSFNWSGVAAPAYEMASTPLVMYYLALVIKLFGEREIILHLFLLPFSLLALYSTYLISDYFTKKPLLTTIMVAVAPAFFVSATTLMMDIPFLSLSLLTIVFFLKAIKDTNKLKKSEKITWVIFAGLTAGAASLVKYTAVVPTAIVALGFLVNKKFRSLAIFLLITVAIFALWNGYFFSIYHTIHPFYVRSLPTAGYVLNASYTISQLINPTFLSFFGGTTLFFAPLIILGQSRRQRLITFISSGIYLFFIFSRLSIRLPDRLINRLLFFIFAINGVLLLTAVIIRLFWQLSSKKKNWQLTFLAIWLTFSFTIPLLLNPFLAVRFLTFPLIPVSILATQQLNNICKVSKRYATILVWATIIITLWLSLMIAIGDMRWANMIRNFVQQPRSFSEHQTTVWYLGHWGLQYYVERNGKNFFDLSRAKLKANDIIILPTNIPSQSHPSLLRSKKIATIPIYHHWPFVTMSWPSGAGWYSHRWGILPYVISNREVETINVWQYNP